jgi:hypothetical protein
MTYLCVPTDLMLQAELQSDVGQALAVALQGPVKASRHHSPRRAHFSDSSGSPMETKTRQLRPLLKALLFSVEGQLQISSRI